MRYASVCSGIEAASVAWEPLGWKPVWFCEFEDFPSAVLKFRYPNTPNLGDMTKLKENEIYGRATFDLLVGGTPCQSFSVAGLRKGLDDERGNLALEYCRILIDKQPKWFVWENVPGVLSSKGGEDFASILTAFRECGYSVAYRVLDAQYFGVPQRRRRVFVVGHLGDDWRPPYAVLFEPKSLRRDSKKGGAKRKEVTGTITSGFGSRGLDADQIADGALSEMHHQDSPMIISNGQANCEIVSDGDPSLTCNHEAPILIPATTPEQAWPAQKANTLNAHFGEKQGLENEHINAGAPLFVPHELIVLNDQGGDVINVEDGNVSPTLRSETHGNLPIICFDNTQITSPQNGSSPQAGGPAHTISKGNAHNACIVSIQATQIGRSDTAGPQGSGISEDAMFTLTKGDVHAVADLRVATPGGYADYEVAETCSASQSRTGEDLIFGIDSEQNVSENKFGTLVKGGEGGTSQAIAIIGNSESDINQRTDGALCARDYKGVGSQYMDEGKVVVQLGHTKSNGLGVKESEVANTFQGVSSANQAVMVSPTITSFNMDSRSPQSEEQQKIEAAVYSNTNKIRRITPVECARLQGFPDNWTKIPWKGKPADQCPDEPQYKAYGNSMAVPVMNWIGSRIQKVDEIISNLQPNKNQNNV